MKKILSFVVLIAAVAMVGCCGNCNKKAAAEEKACCEKCEQAEACAEKGECCCGKCETPAAEAAVETPAETPAAE